MYFIKIDYYKDFEIKVSIAIFIKMKDVKNFF